MRHATGCAQPELAVTWRGRLGDLMQTCNSCGSIGPADDSAPKQGPDNHDGLIAPQRPDARSWRRGDQWPTHVARARNSRQRASYERRMRRRKAGR